jgi:hypothetical protein
MNNFIQETVPNDPFEQLGLLKKEIGGIHIYTLEFNSKLPLKDTLTQLRSLISDQDVGVEVGTGNQLDSLLYIANKVQTQYVIGIDTDYDFSSIRPPNTQNIKTKPTIFLFKGDAWGDERIHNFFGTYDNQKRWVKYAQIIAPDTLYAEAMIDSTLPITRGSFMVVLDSGAIEELSSYKYPKNDIHTTILNERGYINPTQLDWMRNRMRTSKMKEINSEEYQKAIITGKYPNTAFLRAGKMLIFEKQV